MVEALHALEQTLLVSLILLDMGTANFFEGSGSAPAPSATTSDIREC